MESPKRIAEVNITEIDNVADKRQRTENTDIDPQMKEMYAGNEGSLNEAQTDTGSIDPLFTAGNGSSQPEERQEERQEQRQEERQEQEEKEEQELTEKPVSEEQPVSGEQQGSEQVQEQQDVIKENHNVNIQEKPSEASTFIDKQEPETAPIAVMSGGVLTVDSDKSVQDQTGSQASASVVNTKGQPMVIMNSKTVSIKDPNTISKIKKLNHKEVERRRRETINNAIRELQAIVPTTHTNKSQIIRKAVEHIKKLKEREETMRNKWTLEKIITDQAINELANSNEKLKSELEKAYRENELRKNVIVRMISLLCKQTNSDDVNNYLAELSSMMVDDEEEEEEAGEGQRAQAEVVAAKTGEDVVREDGNEHTTNEGEAEVEETGKEEPTKETRETNTN